MIFPMRNRATMSPARVRRDARVGRHPGRPAVEALEGRALLAAFLPYHGHYYALTGGLLTWQQAERQAVATGGHLAAVTSQGEQDFLDRNFAAHEDVWIGLSDHVKEGRFTWSTGERVAYTAFLHGEPNNLGGAEDYVQMNLGTGRWNDNTATALHRGIIELNHAPAAAGKAATSVIEVSFAKDGNGQARIQFDPTKSIPDVRGRGNYFRVDVKIDAIALVKPYTSVQLDVNLYWATASGVFLNGDSRFAGRLTTGLTNRDAGTVVHLFSNEAPRVKRPANATHIIGILDQHQVFKPFEHNLKDNTALVPIAAAAPPPADVIQLRKVGATAINPANNYSEDTTVQIRVVHAKGGLLDDQFNGNVTLTEAAGTLDYTGLHGSTPLPMTVQVKAGMATVVLRSVSESSRAGGPPDAKIVATSAAIAPGAAITPLAVDQWVDNDRDQIPDWLEQHAKAILAAAARAGGEVGEIVRTVSLGPWKGGTDSVPGETPLHSAVITLNPATTLYGSLRLNTSILGKVVLHEARHAWQNHLLKIPSNDKDGDLLPQVAYYADAAGIVDPDNRHATDPAIALQKREADATAFGRKYGPGFL